MIVSLYAKNTEGITEEEISFVSKDKNREISNSVFKTKDGIYINKQLAILGANASGKTSTLKIIENVCSFITFPSLIESFLKDFKDTSEKDLAAIKTMINKFAKLNSNVNTEENSKVILDFYIEDDLDRVTGYYTYKIVFKNEDGEVNVLKEELTFREKYLSKKRNVISYKENIKNSQVGYLFTFLTNFEEKTAYFDYIRAFVFNITMSIKNIAFDNYSTNLNLYEMFEEKKDLVLKIVNLVDSQIIDFVRINENEEKSYDVNEFKFKTISGKFLNYEKLSLGTKKVLVLISEIIHLFMLDNVILIDEIDSAISKNLIDIIFKTFYVIDKKSQLIVTTNYPDIIPDNFTYDQIYMLKKVDGKTICSRLSESNYNNGKRVRSDISFSRAYKEGRFNDEEEAASFNKRVEEYIKVLKKNK